LGLSDDPKISIMFLILGLILLFGLNIVASNGLIGASSSVLYIVIALVLILIKGERRT